MGLNDTPSADRVHIGFFGRRNAGKSSVVNRVTGQQLSVVSDVKGTTTDPVYKAMELLPVGPVMIIDTPGMDDEGELGLLRVKKAKQVLNKTDVAILIVDAMEGLQAGEQEMIALFEAKEIPYIIVMNKKDLLAEGDAAGQNEHSILVSAKTGENIHELKEKIAALASEEESEKRIVADLLSPMDFVVLVVPIDKAAPKGRLILPQQQTIRDILEANAVSVVVKETELKDTLNNMGTTPKLVITDSQAFAQVSADTPEDIMLTSFSILFARYKGNLKSMIAGVTALKNLQDGDKILISEGCTHHRQCDDIGTVKLPGWIREFTGVEPEFSFTSGAEFPDDLSEYKMIIHCGGCMLNEREVKYRIKCAEDQNIPMTNYGIAIAYMKGILKRSLTPFPDIAELLD